MSKENENLRTKHFPWPNNSFEAGQNVTQGRVAHRFEVLNNVPGVKKRTKGPLIARSGAQADNMQVFEQYTKLADWNTGTVAPADQEIK